MNETKFWELMAKSDGVAPSPRARALSAELCGFVRAAFSGERVEDEEDEDVTSYKRFFGFDRPSEVTRWKRSLFAEVGQ